MHVRLAFAITFALLFWRALLVLLFMVVSYFALTPAPTKVVDLGWATIDRWLWPDVFKNQDTSVAKAKKPITDYKKAAGQAEGLAEIMVFNCERAAGFSMEVDLQDEDYFNALVRMFEQALKTVASLAAPKRPPLWDRLDTVRRTSDNFGYSVGDDMDDLLAEYGAND